MHAGWPVEARRHVNPRRHVGHECEWSHVTVEPVYLSILFSARKYGTRIRVWRLTNEWKEIWLSRIPMLEVKISLWWSISGHLLAHVA